jgi:quercetin dioxygenase-like cupin family protein
MPGKETVIDPEKVEWETSQVPGVRFKLLFKNEETGALITLTHFPKGAGIPNPHLHPSNQFMYVLKGKFSYPGIVVKEGEFYINPKDHVHGPSEALEDTLVLEMVDGPLFYPEKKPS